MMKKQILWLALVLWLVWFGQAAVLDEAVTWMNTNELTIFNNVADYKPNNYIRRDEAAKLLVKFAKIQNKTTYVKTEEQCQFSDLNDAHADLKDIVVESCRLGIFQWSAGKFMPTWSLTNEQSVTVLVRIVVGTQSETGVSSRSDNYYKVANEKWLLSQVNMADRKALATRGNVGLSIYAVDNLKWDADIAIEDSLNKMNLISQYYKFLSQKDFKNACSLKNNNQNCEKQLENTYANILIAIPVSRDVKFIKETNQITFPVYYEDKKTLLSSIYTVTKKIENNKITDISSEVEQPLTDSPLSLTTTNKNIQIYKISTRYTPVSDIFIKTLSQPLDPNCETKEALLDGYWNDKSCDTKAFPIFRWWIVSYNELWNISILNNERLSYMKSLYEKAYRLYNNEKPMLYSIVDHSNLIGNWYSETAWEKNWYSKDLLNDIFAESGICWIGSDFYAVNNLLWYKEWSNDFIKDYQIWDLWAIEPYYAWSKYLLFSDLSGCGQLKVVGQGSYKLQIK